MKVGGIQLANNANAPWQLTNILRDVGQDARDTGRIYLSRDLMAAHDVTEEQILAGHYDEHLHGLADDTPDFNPHPTKNLHPQSNVLKAEP